MVRGSWGRGQYQVPATENGLWPVGLITNEEEEERCLLIGRTRRQHIHRFRCKSTTTTNINIIVIIVIIISTVRATTEIFGSRLVPSLELQY